MVTVGDGELETSGGVAQSSVTSTLCSFLLFLAVLR